MRVSDFDFDLPPDLIAQAPPDTRGASRLLVVRRATGALTHGAVADLPSYLAPGDLVVVNDTRVFPARLHGRRVPSGGRVECLLLRRIGDDRWDALVHPGQKLRPGERIAFGEGDAALEAEILDRRTFGRRTIRLRSPAGAAVDAVLDRIGHVPLPPYIHRDDTTADRERYQTVFARVRGSVAAPTAGLHLTTELLSRVEAAGAGVATLTLHVGYGTFKPTRTEIVEEHTVDPEPFAIGAETAARVNAALDAGRRVVAVGTTTTRALESVAAAHDGRIAADAGETGLFIYPGHAFRVVGGLLTNFHLPRSSLLMLACAFGGTDLILRAYREAIAARYRFYSYGDAMLIL